MIIKFSYYVNGELKKCEYRLPERLKEKELKSRIHFLVRMMLRYLYDHDEIDEKNWLGGWIYENEVCIAKVAKHGAVYPIEVADLHCHIVPKFDDGSTSVEMSMEMIDMLYRQNVRTLFCTSHSWNGEEFKNLYIANFNELKKKVDEKYSDFSIYTGSEILCDSAEIDMIIRDLNNGILFPLGNTKYILAEFFFDVKPREIIYVVHKLLLNGWIPIISHIERYSNIFDDDTVDCILDMGALIQVNAHSFCAEKDMGRKNRAKMLLKQRKVHFIGSDAHRIDHRKPDIAEGIEYIYQNCTETYARQVCNLNVKTILNKGALNNDR